MKDPAAITPADVIGRRDELVRKKRRPATVCFKLSVVRSFFEHLRASGLVSLNPASTRLVSPPALPEESAGRALTPREALILLAGPDRRKAEGACDHALMLAMLRLGLRVSEVCGLRSSPIRRSHGRRTLRIKVKGAGNGVRGEILIFVAVATSTQSRPLKPKEIRAPLAASPKGTDQAVANHYTGGTCGLP